MGDLNIDGMSREVGIPITYNGRVRDLAGKMRVGFEGHVTINRKGWGIVYKKLADNGGLVAANEVTIELDIEAVSMPAKSGVVSFRAHFDTHSMKSAISLCFAQATAPLRMTAWEN